MPWAICREVRQGNREDEGRKTREKEMEIDHEEYRRLAREIANPDSPVGIDAEKTHVMILHRLERLDVRLERLEKSLRAGQN